LVGDGFGEEGLAGSWGTVEDDAFGWLDAHLFVQFGVEEGQLDCFPHFLDLLFQPANVCI
jgi:hypothetical protein